MFLFFIVELYLLYFIYEKDLGLYPCNSFHSYWRAHIFYKRKTKNHTQHNRTLNCWPYLWLLIWKNRCVRVCVSLSMSCVYLYMFRVTMSRKHFHFNVCELCLLMGTGSVAPWSTVWGTAWSVCVFVCLCVCSWVCVHVCVTSSCMIVTWIVCTSVRFNVKIELQMMLEAIFIRFQ